MVQVQNIDKICRENLNTYPFEYIVIENFITGLEDKNLFENYIKSQETLSQEEFLHDDPQHVSAYLDIIEKIRQKNKDIVEAINNVWDINCKYFYGVENMISKNQKLQMHNDYYGDEETPNNPFVRGVIYLILNMFLVQKYMIIQMQTNLIKLLEEILEVYFYLEQAQLVGIVL